MRDYLLVPKSRKAASIFAIWVALIIASTSSNSATPAGDVSSLKAKYRPSRPNAEGSVSDATFRKDLAVFFWNRQINSLVTDSALSFLRSKLYKGEQLGQILVLDPGTPPPDFPQLEEESLRSIMEDPQLFSQIAARVLPPGEWLRSDRVKDTLPPASLRDLSTDSEFIELLMTWSSPADFMPEVLRILCEIRAATSGEDWQKYKKIALAIALVSDQSPPPSLPHSQVHPSALPPSKMTHAEKFKDITQTASAGHYLIDISRLSVGEAFFLVSHNLPKSELEWARKNRVKNTPQTLASSAFDSIDYDDSRVDQQDYVWKGVPYTLKNISEMGGICIDQAYYADAMCKASGIPSVVFAGTGDEGGHAWVGFLSQPGDWDVNVGRSSGVYMTGKTLNPQNWQTETDHDFIYAMSESSSTSKLESLLADIFLETGEKDLAAAAITSAGQLAPGDTSLWAKKTKILSKLLPPEEFVRKMKSYLWAKEITPSVKAGIKKEIAKAERSAGRHMSASRFEKAIVKENFSTRSDISSQQIGERIKELLDKDLSSKAMLEYKSAIRTVPSGAAGDFFYGVTRPLTLALSERGERAQAIQAVKVARQKINPPKESLLDLDMKELESIAQKTKYTPQKRQPVGKN
jgi:hypothetical protein